MAVDLLKIVHLEILASVPRHRHQHWQWHYKHIVFALRNLF